MTRTPRRTGEGKLGCILWLVLVAALGLVCYRAIPVKVKSSELYDYMIEQAKFAGRTKADTLKKRVLQRARELGLPVTEKDLSVSRAGGRIRMHVEYTVPLDLYVYTYEWHIEYDVDRPIFVI